MSSFVHGWPKDRKFSIKSIRDSLTDGWPDTRRVWILRVILTVVLLALAIGLGCLHVKGTYKPIMNCRYVFRNQVSQLGEWVCVGTPEGRGDYVPQVVKDIASAPQALVADLRNRSINFEGVFIEKDSIGVHIAPNWDITLPPGDITLLPAVDWYPLRELLDPQPVKWPPFPGLAGLVNPPLEWLRGLTVWTILGFFVIASLVVTIVVKIVGPPIVRLVTFDPEEWKNLLGTLRTWAVILAVFLLLFLISVWQGGGLALPPFR
jgi:hypothetical protein